MNKAEAKKVSYEFYGAPQYDPKKENRIYIKCKKLSDIEKKVDTFIRLAIKKGASIIEIRNPSKSTKEGFAELYSDAGITEKILNKNTGLRGVFTRLFENRGERGDEQ